MSIEKEIESMDEKELRELFVKIFDGIKTTNKTLDESHDLVNKNYNIVHVNKSKSGVCSTDDGREIVKDKHGLFVVSETNEVLRIINELKESELIIL